MTDMQRSTSLEILAPSRPKGTRPGLLSRRDGRGGQGANRKRIAITNPIPA